MFHFRRKDKDEKNKKKTKDVKEKKEGKHKERPLSQDELERLEEAKSHHFDSHHDITKIKERPTSLKLPSDSSDSSLSSISAKSPENATFKNNGNQKLSNRASSPPKLGVRPPVPTSNPPIIKSHNIGRGILKGRTSSLSKTSEKSISGGSKLRSLDSRSNSVSSPVQDQVDNFHVVNKSLQQPGIGFGINATKLTNLNLALPQIEAVKVPAPRTLIIPRLPAGDFGFSLRRAAIIDKQQPNNSIDQPKRTIIFAEPGSLGKTNGTGLFPGDRLLEVNDVSVATKTRDEIIGLIKSSGDKVKLCVQLIPELVELTLRSSVVDEGQQVSLNDDQIRGGTLSRSGSLRFKKLTKSEDELVRDRVWLDEERVWVLQKNGFSAAKRVKCSPKCATTEGKVKVQTNSKGILEVEEMDIETANPPHLDKVEDLSQLRYLNESSILHVLRQRYANSLIHTYSGNSMVVVNPGQPLPIYSEKVMLLFKGCRQEDMPPHIYAVAQSAYRKLLTTRKDQSIVLTGRSGSGKTSNFRHLLQYLVQISGSINKFLTAEKINAVQTLLEAFGNCRTVSNANATRFTQLFSVDYDQSGQICSASVQAFLLERNRVARRPVKEPTFHILYQMIAGIDDVSRKELKLENLSDFNIFMSPLQRIEDKQKATLSWACVRNALELIDIKNDEVKALTSVLAAIYHLGSAGAIAGNGSSARFSKPQNAQKAALLLGISTEDLTRAVFHNLSAKSYQGTCEKAVAAVESTNEDAVEALEAVVGSLYAQVFDAIVSLINRCLSSANRSVSSISILDSPGLQNPATCGRTSGASFQELCQNYAQDRLQTLYHENSFVLQQEKYTQENVHFDLEDMVSFISSPSTLVNILDKQSQQGLLTLTRSSTTDLREVGGSDGKGLLWILEEEALYPGSTDDSFLDKVKSTLTVDKSKNSWLKVDGKQLIVNHMQGTNPVTYNVDGWLKICRENPAAKNCPSILQDSDHESISKLFVYSRGSSTSAGNLNLMCYEAGNSASLRRMSSIRRCVGGGGGGLKRRCVALQVKFVMDAIVETLRRTCVQFVQFVIPHHATAAADVKVSELSLGGASKVNGKEGQFLDLDVPLLRAQIQGFQVLDSLRMYKQGFPEQMAYGEFKRRFAILLPAEDRTSQSSDEPDERKSVDIMLSTLDIEKSSYRLGTTKILLRVGILAQLDNRRDNKLQGLIVRLQGYCRGYLGRKRMDRLRVEDVAIRCIQKNVRKFNGIKMWPWWRLYVKLLPVLNVHRTEQDLKDKQEELQGLRSKVEKLEKDRSELKHQRDKLEAKMSELSADLVEEHATTVQAAEVLDVQSMERMRLEKEVHDLHDKLSRSQKYTHDLEMEVMEARMFQTSAINGDASDDDSGMSSVYKERYERSVREFDFKIKKLKQQREEEVEQEVMLRKAVDKKLNQSIADLEEERHHTSQWKKKYQKLNSEIQDFKILLETEASRNAVLEKKQRRFDSESSLVQEELKHEKVIREKVSREKEQLQAEKYSFEQELQATKVDCELKSEKIVQLNRELDELAYGKKGEDEIFQLKKGKHELERKVQDQEEELDDLAGQVQMLEQAKLRLEMSMEKAKQEFRKELNAKEEEAEEVRAIAIKKVKAMELQLENEHDERQQISRQRHELERQIVELQDRPPQVDVDVERRLKRDLKRTKALLRDSQLTIGHSSENLAHKSTIRQLKNQLEDADFAKMSAIKSKQGMEMELEDVKSHLEEISKAKCEAVKKCSFLGREKAELQSQLEESEEEIVEIMKKYKAAVFQLSTDQATLNEQSMTISDLEAEKQSLKTLLSELTSKVEILEGETTDMHTVKRLEMKIKELESKLELENTHKARLENQQSRLKEQCERMEQECAMLRSKEQDAIDGAKKLNRQARELREDFSCVQQKEYDYQRRVNQLEMALENADSEHNATKADLKLAFRRIDDLQAAIEGDMASDYSEFSDSNLDTDNDCESVENINTFLERRQSSAARYRCGSTSSSEGISSSVKHSSSAEFHSLSPGGASRYDKMAGFLDEPDSNASSHGTKNGKMPQHEEFV